MGTGLPETIQFSLRISTKPMGITWDSVPGTASALVMLTLSAGSAVCSTHTGVVDPVDNVSASIGALRAASDV